MRKLTLRPRLKKTGKYPRATWYCIEDGCYMNNSKILLAIKNSTKLSFDFNYDGPHAHVLYPKRLLHNLLSDIEIKDVDKRNNIENINANTRAIKNGDRMKYARLLESIINTREKICKQ